MHSTLLVLYYENLFAISLKNHKMEKECAIMIMPIITCRFIEFKHERGKAQIFISRIFEINIITIDLNYYKVLPDNFLFSKDPQF